MKKRLLTLEDLYAYYSSNSRSSHFSAKTDGDNIVVQVSGSLEFDDNSDSNIEGLLPVELHACHDLDNINGSFIAKENMENALPSFSNRPILGFIHIVDGQPEFYDHRMHLDEEGELVYDEVPVGIVCESCNARLEYNDDLEKNQVVVNGYIFEEYSKAAEILRRENQCDVSVELTIRELSYDAKEKRLNIENFYFSGVTILGKHPNGDPVKPGMIGSNIKLADFKQKNTNSLFSEKKLIEMLEKISDKLDSISNFTINKTTGKEENLVVDMENMEVTENLEVVQEEASDEVTETATEGDEVTEVETEDVTEDTPNEVDGEEEDTEEAYEGNDENDNVDEAEVEEEKYFKTFEISHDDIRCGLYKLLEDFEIADNTIYYITNVYNDHFVYEDWFTGTNTYGQKYSVVDDNISFDGERYNLHKELLTDAEYAELQSMRNNYAALVEYKENKEAEIAHNEKMSALEGYDSINNTEEYKNLVENIDNYSIEDISEKADAIVGKYARQGMQFSFNNNTDSKVKIILNPNAKIKKNQRSYAGLFD